MLTLADLASLFADAFVTRKRDDDEEFFTLIDGAPEWMTDIVRTAHDGLMPNDWSYRLIRSVAMEISDLLTSNPDADADDLDEWRHERIDSLIPVYNAERLDWVSSNLYRAEYVNDAIKEYGVGDDPDLFQMLAFGMEREIGDIWHAIMKGLEERAEWEAIDADEDA